MGRIGSHTKLSNIMHFVNHKWSAESFLKGFTKFYQRRNDRNDISDQCGGGPASSNFTKHFETSVCRFSNLRFGNCTLELSHVDRLRASAPFLYRVLSPPRGGLVQGWESVC